MDSKLHLNFPIDHKEGADWQRQMVIQKFCFDDYAFNTGGLGNDMMKYVHVHVLIFGI